MTRPENDTGGVELLTFRLGDEVFCLDIMSVRELRGWTRPTPLPHAPACLAGVINLRGTILPVIDLATRLGMAPVAADPRHVIVVVEAAGQTAGLIVEAVSDIHTIARASLEPPPSLSAEGSEICIAALALVEDHMIRIVDLAAILPTVAAHAA